MAITINGEEIDDSMLEEEFDAIKEHHEALGDVVCCDRDEEFRGYARENVINRTLLRQASVERFGEPADQEISEAIEQLKKDHGGEEKFYENVRMNPDQGDEVKRKVSTMLSVDKIIADHVGADPEPSDEELDKFRRKHIEDYMTDEQVHVWHIYLEPHSPEEAEKFYKKLREARTELKEGADFEGMCRELCRDDHQMDLGFFKREGKMPDVETLTFSLDVDEISPVVATHYGYHIFKVVERKEPEPVPFEELKDKLLERYLTDHRESKLNELLESLKIDAMIVETEAESENEPELETA